MSVQSITIPMPLVRPFDIEITPADVQDVWDTYVKPNQEAELPQSGEERVLMAILRAVYDGLGGS